VDAQLILCTYLPALETEIHASLMMNVIMIVSLALDTLILTVALVASTMLLFDLTITQATVIVTKVSIHSLHPITVYLTTTTLVMLRVQHANVTSQNTVLAAKKVRCLMRQTKEVVYVNQATKLRTTLPSAS
jgi:hypothetical protein